MALISAQLPLAANAALFTLAAVVIGVAGWKLAATANEIAERTGLGQALTGAVFLGAATSLSGTVTSVTAAAAGHGELAFSNAIGGIAAQTAFLAVADMTYARANLEHAAASVANIMQGTLLVAMLGLVLAGMTAPPVAWWGVHPVCYVLPVAYVLGVRMVSRAHTEPMWRPQRTAETREDAPAKRRQYRGLARLWLRFIVLAAPVAVAGWVVAESGVALARQTGLSQSAVGALFTAVATSFPELVTCLAAVRQGALTLAVGDIIGGNVFDTLFLPLSDIAYREGSILHAAGWHGQFITVVPVLLTGVLLMGLVRREKSGIANIGFESFLVLVIYLAMAAVLLIA
ncbi:MAG TPA: sodium:calcium antiporter [Pelomicrobium sp.]|nr:sodium:calcium antiporter [Pelomicrobium sp.]